MKLLTFLFTLLISISTANAQWQKVDAKTEASFRGLDVVSENVIWASGTGGTFIRSIDGGKTWKTGTVKGAEKLDFRDIEAFDENTAYVLSIGNADASRIYKTTDGGDNWKLQFTNPIKDAFFDSIAFWDEKNGMAQSDPVDGKYVLFRTTDGETWQQVTTKDMPSAKEGEAAFAASGTCIITAGKKRIWLITGGMDARVFYSKNRGKSWKAYDTPIVNGTAGSGIFSIAMRDKKHGVIVGGNYEKPNETNNNLALTNNGGKTWNLAKGLGGYRSGVAYIDENTIIAVGSGGSDISTDGGKTWKNLDKENYNAVQSLGANSTWAVGPQGMVAKYSGIRNVLDLLKLQH
jgi:photosystem II stability/assembly factor-like uncharacterized protein